MRTIFAENISRFIPFYLLCGYCLMGIFALSACFDPIKDPGPTSKDTVQITRANPSEGGQNSTADTLGGRTIRQVTLVGNRLFASSKEGLFWSNDWGKTWMKISGNGFPDVTNPSDTRFNGTSYVVEQQGIMIVGRSLGGVWMSLDSGRTWKQTVPDKYIPSAGSANGNSTLLVMGDTLLLPVTSLDNINSYIMLSTDRGATWSEVYDSKGSLNITGFVKGQDKITAFGAGGQLITSPISSGLKQWTHTDNIPETTDIYYPIDLGNNTILVSSTSGIYVSNDGGQSWGTNRAGLPPLGYANAIAVNETHVFTATALNSQPSYPFSGIFVRRKQGNSWIRMEETDNIIPLGKQASESNSIYVFSLTATNDRLIIGTNGDGVKTYQFKNPFP